ncbi:MAG: hypothetical protein JWR59_2180 [Brevundimonas sp.]|nr:hypothetical protein [Brevundimonas sp.]
MGTSVPILWSRSMSMFSSAFRAFDVMVVAVLFAALL